MKSLRQSLGAKLTIGIATVTTISLSVAFSLVALSSIRALERATLSATAAVASVVGEYSVSSLAFSDRADATDVLGRLRAFPQVRVAALYAADGALFATYAAEGEDGPDVPDSLSIEQPRQFLDDDYIEVARPIVYDGRSYGTMLLRSSTSILDEQIRSELLALAAILGAVLAASLLIGWWLQRFVSRRILALADVAERISRGGDVSLRADDSGDDELGSLGRSFNAMMDNLEGHEQRLREAKEMVEALIEAAPLAVVATSGSGEIVQWNPGAEATFGAGADRALGRKPRDAMPAAIAELLERPAGGGEGAEADVHLPDAGGPDRMLRALVAPLPHGGRVLLAADETERKLTEAALAERDRQLERAQRLELVGRLASGVAHDFNNLLTVVLTSGRLLRRRFEPGREHADPAALDKVHAITEAAQRGAALTRRLGAFGRRHVQLEAADVNAVVRDLERVAGTVLGEDVRLTLEPAPVPAVARIDIGQLEQVLLNVVLNARDAMPSGGAVSIHVKTSVRRPEREGEWLVIEVKDTGIGMSEEVRSRIFEPFFTTKERGTGLGLASAHHIVRQFGGDMEVASEPGKGTTFTLWLPLVEGARATRSPRATPAVARGTETILLVEDQADIRSLAAQSLEEAGYHVMVARDGVDALQVAAQAKRAIDLLVTDVVMPRMDGPTLADELARRQPGIAVLYISGYVGGKLAGRGLESQRLDLLEKPFTMETLTHRARVCLDERRAAAAESQQAP